MKLSSITGALIVLLCRNAAAMSCETATNWNDFVRIANLAMRNGMDTICFNSFHIIKPQNSRLLLNRPISLQCGPTESPGTCIIEGSGTQVRIAGPKAEVSLTGFTFTKATECAVWISPTTLKSHLLIDCVFIDNHAAKSAWRGGAIKTEAGTSLTLSSCHLEGNAADGGGAIFHKGSDLHVIHSTFINNAAKEGGAINVETGSALDIFDSDFRGNIATASKGGAVEVRGTNDLTYDMVSGSSNSPCNGIYDRNNKVCLGLTTSWDPPADDGTFVMGDLTVNDLGLKLSTGLSVKILARAGQRVPLTSPEKTRALSVLRMHTNPDGAAVFPLDDGGYMYLSNAENFNGEGGVFGIEFDSNGLIRDYVSRLTGTTRNCAGGKTPWNTWVSCEEYGRGQCWQVDPTGKRPSVKTKLVEPAGGNFEAMAYDISDPDQPRFFVTEDHVRGALRRFTPSCNKIDMSWNLIQVDGDIDYLQMLPNNKFRWTSSLEKGRDSAEEYTQYLEGISYQDGILSFVAKRQKELFHLDLAAGTYTVIRTNQGTLPGGGTFGAGPDQLVQKGETLYFTEDGGGNPGVFVHDGDSFYTLFESTDNRFKGDETTGVSFSPDGTKLYVCMQEIGFFYEITRDDGQAFPGKQRVSTLRAHNDDRSND